MNTKFPWRYLLLAYSLSWLFWIPVALTRKDYQSSPLLLVLVLIGVFGPGIAGIALTYVEKGKVGGQDFWKRVFDFKRIGTKWYIGIILLWPALHLIALAITWLLQGSYPDFEFVNQLISDPFTIPVVVILYLLQAALEELGWRGYMQDRVQRIWNPAIASLVIGVCHAFWHLPNFWIVGTNQIKWGFGIDFSIFVGFIISTAIYSTWFYNANGRSTLAVILLHCAGNLSLDIFSASGNLQRIFFVLSILGAVAIFIIWIIRNHISTDEYVLER